MLLFRRFARFSPLSFHIDRFRPSSIQGSWSDHACRPNYSPLSRGLNGKSSLRTSDHGNLAMRKISPTCKLPQTKTPSPATTELLEFDQSFTVSGHPVAHVHVSQDLSKDNQFSAVVVCAPRTYPSRSIISLRLVSSHNFP